MNEKTRAYIYRAILAISPIVVAYGLLTSEEVALWTTLIANLLGIGLATINTSTKGDDDAGK